MSDWANQLVETRRRELLGKREPHQAYARTCIPIIRSLHESILGFLRRLPSEIRVAVSDESVSRDSSLFEKYELVYSAYFPNPRSPLLNIQGAAYATRLKSSEIFGALLGELEGSLDCVHQCEQSPMFTIAVRPPGVTVGWFANYKCGSAPWPPRSGFEFGPVSETKRTELSFLEKMRHAGKAFRYEETKTHRTFSALSDEEIEGIVRSAIQSRPFVPTALAFGTVYSEHKTWLG